MGSKIMSVMTVVHVSETVGSLATYGIKRTIYLSRPVTVLSPKTALSRSMPRTPGPGPEVTRL